MEQRGIEHPATGAPIVANRRVDDAKKATEDDERRREVSASETHEADAVEAALAEAIRGATAGEQWDVVVELARELEARRLARSANVVPLRGDRAAKRRP